MEMIKKVDHVHLNGTKWFSKFIYPICTKVGTAINSITKMIISVVLYPFRLFKKKSYCCIAHLT